MINIAMIGVGSISGAYIKNIVGLFKEIQLVGLCDLIPEKAEAGQNKVREMIGNGSEAPVPKIYADMYEAFGDPEVDVILNLTRPYQHYEVTRQALLHGKHVYSEKPLAVDMDEAKELVAIAEEKGLHLGGAPDTFMGAGIQTCRKLIDSGFIGNVIGADCAMKGRGPEDWHPDPEFFYKRGGGPMLDMGPYYVTALVNLLGEAKEICGMTRKSFPDRIATCPEHFGEKISVDIDTHLTGCIRFSSGAIATITTSFDTFYTYPPHFEIFGTKGTLVVPDPNTFGGQVLLFRPEDEDSGMRLDRPPYFGFRNIPLMFDYKRESRGLGLADMCKSIESGRNWRANYKQQYHVLEILTSFTKASESGKTLTLESRYERSAPMKNNPVRGILEG